MTLTPLAEALDPDAYGGKASALARSLSAGLPVPDGFALSWDFVEQIVADDDHAITLTATWFAKLSHPVSVRSSAIGEDSAEASFAGQHATVLNVRSAEQLFDAIRTVHRSAGTEAAMAYRERSGVETQPRIGVVAQKMLAPDIAGVLFTRNPLTGANERVIESAWGLGEAVVAGLVTPDRFRVGAEGTVLERIAGVKDLAIVARADGLTEEVAIDEERARAISLSDEQLRQLHELAARCEGAFGSEQDLEWAFENDRLYLLQARPITRIGGVTSATESERIDQPLGYSLPTRRFVGLGLAALLAPLNSTIVAVALPAIGADLQADAAGVTRWLVTSYLLVSIIAQSPGGKLGDLLGSSRVLTIGRALFALGAVVSVFAPTLAVLAVGRVVMATGGALTIPTAMAELRNNTAPHRRGRLFGMFGAIMGTAAGVGPLLGGLLTSRFGWHSIFLVNLPVVLLSFLLEPPHRETKRGGRAAFDFAGATLFAIAIMLFVLGLQRRDLYAPLLIAAGLLLGGIFIRRETGAEEPMLDVALFRTREFAAGGAIVALQNLAMYATLFLLPFLLASSARASAAGMAMMAMTAAMVVGSPLGGRLSDRFGPRSIAFAGGLVAFAGAVVLYSGEVSLSARMFLSLMLLGGGLGLSTGPAQVSALGVVAREKAGMASGALATMRYLGGVIGSALVGVVATTAGRGLALIVFPGVLFAAALIGLTLPAEQPHEPVSR